MRLIAGFVLGFIVATVGITGITSLLDRTLNEVQTTLKENAQ